MPEIIHLAVDGMTCAACVSRVEKALGKIEGVKSASVSLASHSARIEGDATPPALIEAIENAGYDAKLLQSDYGSKNSERAIRRELQARIAAIAGLLLCLPFIASMVVMAFGKQTLLSPAQEVLLASILQFGLGMRFYKGTWKALRGGAATMDVLVALGTTAAYGLSFVNWQITGAPHTQAAKHPPHTHNRITRADVQGARSRLQMALQQLEADGVHVRRADRLAYKFSVFCCLFVWACVFVCVCVWWGGVLLMGEG